ncbi:Ribonuclease H-like superfamily [Sesbania bispinosa]|nr:Ribonuclease H-like superfamily [Sesbania bispinosa]
MRVQNGSLTPTRNIFKKRFPIQRLLFEQIVSPSISHEFFSLPIRDWLLFNLRQSSRFSATEEWKLWFGVSLAQIWFERNKVIFKEETNSVDVAWRIIQHNVNEIKEAFGIGKPVSSSRINNFDLYIKWIPPEDPWIKLNTDGAVNFSMLMAELRAILFGISYVKQLGYSRVIIESDSSVAIRFLKFGCAREGNIVVDAFASYVVSSRKSFHTFCNVPAFASQLLLADSAGICFRRGNLN